MERINKDSYFIEIAKLVAKRSTCIRRQVGAVLVKDSHILSTGYNGAPAGIKHCTKETCVRLKNKIESGKNEELCRAIHAEANCLIQCAIHGTSITGDTTLYSTFFPCLSCLKLILNSGIKKIVYLEDYDFGNKIIEELIKESKIDIIQYITNNEHQ